MCTSDIIGVMEQALKQIILELYSVDIVPQLTRPEPQFGDFSTNAALQLARQLGKNPREIADAIADALRATGDFTKVEVAGPGFINLTILDSRLLKDALRQPALQYKNIRYVLEYSCPNAFKELHTGHLYQTILGDVLARLVEQSGAQMFRTSFGGDVGLHAAKCMFGMVQALGGETPQGLQAISNDPMERARWISACYVVGAGAYEESDSAKQAIDAYNQQIYSLHSTGDHDSAFAQIYWTTRQWSYDYFDAFYDLIKVDHMRYYPESATAVKGLELVYAGKEQGLFTDSEGAVVFAPGDSQHLHTRVFITSKGLPTYETKDLGVIFTEKADYNFDQRTLITGNDQKEYMRVVFAAANALQPGLGEHMTHIMNGTVKFADGKKMSSRLGNVARAADVIDIVREKVAEMTNNPSVVNDIALGAVKYQFLKYRAGGDIAFDIEESVSLQGNSGPYLQYAHARARSVLKKAGGDVSVDVPADHVFNTDERLLVRKMAEYAEVVERAATELAPHHICTYLFELAQEFNRFYEKNRVIGTPEQAARLALVGRYADILRAGLELLGIVAIDNM